MSDVFEKRLRRAEHLQKEWPFAAELLRLYRGIAVGQRRFFSHPPEIYPNGEGFTEAFMADLAFLIDRVAADGPGPLAEEARRWKSNVAETWWKEHGRPHQPGGLCSRCPSPLYHFLAAVGNSAHRMRARADSTRELPSRDPSGRCPFCDHAPAVGVLREDKAAETVRRSLICSLCSLEWDFPRVMCPECREERPEKLPRYTAQEISWMRVEACDTCRKYLKSVDLTLNWDAEPVVDELASTPLDVIAHEHGYAKIAPNLAGI